MSVIGPLDLSPFKSDGEPATLLQADVAALLDQIHGHLVRVHGLLAEGREREAADMLALLIEDMTPKVIL